MADESRLLQRLPEELLQDVIERLNKRDLTSLNLTSRWCYAVATPLIWREVNLRDCYTYHEDGEHDFQHDFHDDTPMLRKLLVLATKPWIASCVHTLNHSCHLPPPGIFAELPNVSFSAQTLSSDPRTAKLVQVAVKNMTKVQTLRIIFGHPNINDVLLRCFFDKTRHRSIRRLWLENCRISAGCALNIRDSPLGLPLDLDFAGLESIRVRRLPLRPAEIQGTHTQPWESRYVYARGGGDLVELQDGAGGLYETTTNSANHELQVRSQAFKDTSSLPGSGEETIETLLEFANQCDDRAYQDLARYMMLPPEVVEVTVESHRERSYSSEPCLEPNSSDIESLSPETEKMQREKEPSLMVMGALLGSCSSTLTSLCLDWVLTEPYRSDEPSQISWNQTFRNLFHLRFPNLKAFQLRNAVVPDAALPDGCYLLDYSECLRREYYEEFRTTGNRKKSLDYTSYDLGGLRFIEAHPNLQCLAWPMDRFFSGRSSRPEISDRVDAVIENFGRTLTDLRVDVMYRPLGEAITECDHCPNASARESRRRFISEFASRMSKVDSIKIEGGVPRDERRETIRALHKSPLEKIVMIGVCTPIGNTWGAEGRDLNEVYSLSDLDMLEAEHKDSVFSIGFKAPEPPPSNFRYEATYGWPPGPPMIHTVASYHAKTIKELKFCGYKGAPILLDPTPITQPILATLKYFDNIEALVLTMWLRTDFEGAQRDDDIIKYWVEARSPASTSLVRLSDEEPEGWEKELRTKFAPEALAWRITNFIGPFLSEKAKARKGGVRVRISMSIGDGGIFDIEVQVGKGSLNSDVCLGYKGPREEIEPVRRKEKLEKRRWF